MSRYLNASLKLLYRQPTKFLGAWLGYYLDFRKFVKSLPGSNPFSVRASYPCLVDKTYSSGHFGRYIYQDSWAFKHVLDFSPDVLVDMASSMYFLGFAAQVTTVISVDIRPTRTSLGSIKSTRGDITDLPFGDGTIEALSSLSVIEHIGLGRYGDTLDYFGMEKAVDNLRRVLKVGGMLLVAFPVGHENSIEFNAHRVCTPEKVFEIFEGLELIDQKYAVADRIVDRNEFEKMGRPYTYGCYRFTKREQSHP